MRKPIRLLLMSVAVILASCESLLDHKPESTLSPENFFKNETELRSFSNKFYDQFPSTSLYEEAYDNYTLENHPAEVRGGRQIPGSGNGWSWEQLRDINTMIEYSVNCTDEAVRTKICELAVESCNSNILRHTQAAGCQCFDEYFCRDVISADDRFRSGKFAVQDILCHVTGSLMPVIPVAVVGSIMI